jgi:hypothetical protein
MFVCCECCVLSDRGLCDELITRPEESYRMWRVVVCDLEKNLKIAEAMTRWVAAPQKKISLHLVSYFHNYMTMHGFMNVQCYTFKKTVLHSGISASIMSNLTFLKSNFAAT